MLPHVLLIDFCSQQNLLTMEQIVSVEETQVKDKKCILLRIKGGKQFVLQCEVGGFLVPSVPTSDASSPADPFRCVSLRATQSLCSGRRS